MKETKKILSLDDTEIRAILLDHVMKDLPEEISNSYDYGVQFKCNDNGLIADIFKRQS